MSPITSAAGSLITRTTDFVLSPPLAFTMVMTRWHSSPGLFDLARHAPSPSPDPGLDPTAGTDAATGDGGHATRAGGPSRADMSPDGAGSDEGSSLRNDPGRVSRGPRAVPAPEPEQSPRTFEQSWIRQAPYECELEMRSDPRDREYVQSQTTELQRQRQQQQQSAHHEPKLPVRVNIYFLVNDTAVLWTDVATESSLRRFTSTGRAALPGSHHLDRPRPGSTAHSGVPMVRDLVLSYGCRRLPSRESFDRLAAWMALNRNIQLPSPVLPLLPPYPAHTSLAVLIDTYAATLALGIMPKPRALRHLILDRVSRTVLGAPDMRFIWDSIPHGDGIVMRFVRAYYYHDRCGNVPLDVKADIYAFTATEPELDEIFAGVEEEIEARRMSVGVAIGPGPGLGDWEPGSTAVGVGESRTFEGGGQQLWME